MKPGKVWIGEDFGDEWQMESGRWDAHWESDDGKDWRQGPEGVSAAEAIAWGREQADVVLIRPGDSETLYSAGARDPEPLPGDGDLRFPRWPEGQELPPRRAAGWEYLDRSAGDPPILWRVRIGGTPQVVEVLAEALRADDAVVDVVAPDSSGSECGFTVRSATIDQARSVGAEIVERAITSTPDGRRADRMWTMGDPEPVDWPAAR